ncbi:MAG: hypothetical protein PHU33_08515 [Bacteroidales bacterium]|nr:hypothetical protein [Bacteroidales bacterium]
MKKIIITLIFASLFIGAYAQGIYNDGVYIVSGSGSYWVVDNGDFTLTSASPANLAQMANLTIAADASITLPATTYLTVSGTLANNSGTDGLVLQSNASGSASLIQSNNAVEATQQRHLTGSTNLEAMTYHLVSVPITPASSSLSELFTGAYLYDFNVASDDWHGLGGSLTTPLDETRGYMVYVPEASHNYTFTGPMNGGAFTALTTHGGSGNNLVPNPYPSAIDWGASSGWTKTNVNNAVYIWPSGGSNYASYVDGVAANGGSRYIPAGQAFFVKTSASSPVLSMTNEVRVHSSQAFFKAGDELPDVLRILATSNGMSDEAVVRFTNQATPLADGDYDAWKMTGTEGAPQLSTLSSDNQPLAINSLPYMEEAYVVPMNFAMAANGSVELLFNIQSFAPAVTIHLRDELANTTTNLRTQNRYTFQHTDGAAEARFKLLFGGAIGTDEPVANPIRQWITGNTLYISAPELTGQQAVVTVYNLVGQALCQHQVVLGELNTLELQATPGAVLVETKSVDGSRVLTTKGIIIK